MGQCSLAEADVILAVEFDVLNGRVPVDIAYPKYITAERHLIARLYARFHSLMQRRLSSCAIFR